MLRDNVGSRGGTLRVALLAAGIGLFTAGSASAAGVVAEWDFILNNGFTAFTSTQGPAGAVAGFDENDFLANNTPASGPLVGCIPDEVTCFSQFIPAPDSGFAWSVLKWGTPSNLDGTNPDLVQSSISVGAANGLFDDTHPDYESIVTDAPEVPTVIVTHDNNAIASGSGRLSTATLTDVLTLIPKTPPGPAFFAPQLTFSIDFIETSNSASPCLVDSPETPCNDVFVIDVEGAGFNPDTLALIQPFTFMGEDYEAVIRLEGLVRLEDDACTAVGADIGGPGLADNCIGLTTIENQPNPFQTFLAINHIAQGVAEPGTLAVLGLGLLGLGFVRRKRLD